MAKKLEELPVYQRAVKFCVAITEILSWPALRRDRDLHDQISEAADSITANMEEGFEQPTDRAFANYVFIAKGSLGEVLGRLRTARRKKHISAAELPKRPGRHPPRRRTDPRMPDPRFGMRDAGCGIRDLWILDPGPGIQD